MMITLPATISVANARLPATYEAAKTALANCASIDECQEWANKAEALASYARMADDDTLRKMADRIQSRAVRRCQELLKQYPEGHGGARRGDQVVGTDNLNSRRQAAHDAGLSDRQYRTAMAVGEIPAAEFEALVESDEPPTVTQLADMGRQRRFPDPPEGFRQATQLLGTVRRFAEFCAANNPEFVAAGVLPSEAKHVRELVTQIDHWLDRFVVNLKDAS